ncbi:MAG: YceI family protein [Bacteroidota bacterium]|nr:YceI family protein [Bacteroidota bacterium]
MSLTKWAIDPMHSEVTFKIKHLMISTVTGHFKKFNLEGETETDDFNTAKKIEFTAEIDSIDTNNEQRDAHLKSPDFFSSEEFPQIKFSSTSYKAKGDDAEINGNITIKGITKPITLDVEFGGIVVDPYGQTKAGFTVMGKLSRKEFGLIYNPLTEAGGVLLGDEIKINAEIQLVKQAKQEVEENQSAKQA